MNSLSWAIYAAGSFDSLKILLGILAVVFGPLFLIATAFQRADALRPSECWAWPKKSVIAAVMMAVACCLLPSAKTVYLIAASEAGERVATSPEGREMLDLVRRRLRDLLTEKT